LKIEQSFPAATVFVMRLPDFNGEVALKQPKPTAAGTERQSHDTHITERGLRPQ
jgi:hypothetical protein